MGNRLLTRLSAILHQPDVPIDQDIACIACGHNLRGLEPEGQCPECGGDISATLSAKNWSPPVTVVTPKPNDFAGCAALLAMALCVTLMTAAITFEIPDLLWIGGLGLVIAFIYAVMSAFFGVARAKWERK